jgi:hypothetical protein
MGSVRWPDLVAIQRGRVVSDRRGYSLRYREHHQPTRTQAALSWILRATVNGRRRDIGLGSARDITLDDTRDQAPTLWRAARTGRDPAAERRAVKRVRLTFEEPAANVHVAGSRHKPEEIIAKLRQVEVMTGQGTTMADVIRSMGVTEGLSLAQRVGWDEARPGEASR